MIRRSFQRINKEDLLCLSHDKERSSGFDRFQNRSDLLCSGWKFFEVKKEEML